MNDSLCHLSILEVEVFDVLELDFKLHRCLLLDAAHWWMVNDSLCHFLILEVEVSDVLELDFKSHRCLLLDAADWWSMDDSFRGLISAAVHHLPISV